MDNSDHHRISLPVNALTQPGRPARKNRLSISRLSSDTTASLPPYKLQVPSLDPYEKPPPDYPNSAENNDGETTPFEDGIPHRRKSTQSSPQLRYSYPRDEAQTEPDAYLDKILERSVAALELSNSLLASTMMPSSSTNRAPAEVPDTEDQDGLLDTQARAVSDYIRANRAAQERWCSGLDNLTKHVSTLCNDTAYNEGAPMKPNLDAKANSSGNAIPCPGISTHRSCPGFDIELQRDFSCVSQSLPSGSLRPRKRTDAVSVRHSSAEPPFRRYEDFPVREIDTGCLRKLLPQDEHQLLSPPPTTLAQCVSAEVTFREPAHAQSASISRCGSRRWTARNSNFMSLSELTSSYLIPSLLSHSIPRSRSSLSCPCSPAVASLARQAACFPSGSPKSPLLEREYDSTHGYHCSPHQRSRKTRTNKSTPSRSSTKQQKARGKSMALIDQPLSRSECHEFRLRRGSGLGSDSRSSSSSRSDLTSGSDDSSGPYRTLESLRRILDEQAVTATKLKLGKGTQHQRTTFAPRSPPVKPVTSTSTTTTSISRLLTRGAHSTTTRPSEKPKSVLKRSLPTDSVGIKWRGNELSDSGSRSTSQQKTGERTGTPDPDLANGKNEIRNETVDGSSLSSPASVSASAASSGRSTPRTVAFGPLPEPYALHNGGTEFGSGKAARFRKRGKAYWSSTKIKKASRDDGDQHEQGAYVDETEDGRKTTRWWAAAWVAGRSVLSGASPFASSSGQSYSSGTRKIPKDGATVPDDEDGEDEFRMASAVSMSRAFGRPGALGAGIGFSEWTI